jgi:Flp pilus assembly protein TadG
MTSIAGSRSRGRRRAAALIEFVIILPFYATVLFATLEFGQVFYDRVQLTNSAREGVIAAAQGKTLAEIKLLTETTAPQMGITDDLIAIEFNSAADGSGSWQAATDSGTVNSIPAGNPCRVTIHGWGHTMVTGGYFTWGNISNGKLLMSATEIAIRGP